MNDRQVQCQVAAQLESDLGAGSFDIGIEVHHGAVKLCGQVGSESRKQLAIEAANKVVGAITVFCGIEVTATDTHPPPAAGA